MRRRASRSICSLVLLAFSSAVLVPTAARADPLSPNPDLSAGAPPIPPPPPLPTSSLVHQPIELRDVFWGSRGLLVHDVFPFQGNRPLNGAELYRVMGREDLAQSYEKRGAAKIALAVASLGALLAGAITMADATPETHCDAAPKYPIVLQPPVCRTDWKSGQIATGVGLALLSPVLMLVAGLGFSTDPLSLAERRNLIDKYNASLGRPATDSAPSVPRSGANHLMAAPMLSSDGAGVTVGGRF